MSSDERSLSDEKNYRGASRPKSPVGKQNQPVITDDNAQSLGDCQTYAGRGPSPKTDRSIGDEYSVVRSAGDDSGMTHDDMEVVDLTVRYRIEKTLGRGGMGEVLLATDTRLGRKVAIKRILGESSGSSLALQRFLIEAKAIALLNHPNIVQVYDYGRAADGPFLILEYVDGQSLLDRCRSGAIPVNEAIEMVSQLCDGLGKAHELGIIHRDIKPANVLLTVDGVPKLTDFGLAKAESSDMGMTMAGAVLGTIDFMSPEQRRDAALTDSRSDLWSLAATLYQMVTGESPKVIRIKKVPEQLQDVLDRALETDPELRYQTADEFHRTLSGVNSERVPMISGLNVSEEGVCPSCRNRNDPNRKYCRNCAKPLRINCLGCNEQIPVWDDVCGECGMRQTELQRRNDEQDKSFAEAELRLKSGDAKTALNLIELFDPNRLTSNQTELRERIEKITSLEQSIELLTKDVNFDRVIDPEKVLQLLLQVSDYLKLNPNDSAILKLNSKL